MNLLIQMLRRSVSDPVTQSVVASLTVGLSLGLIAPSASALTFTKLLEVGQKVPGSDQPVTDIIEPTIGLDGQVTVLLKTQSVLVRPPVATLPTVRTTFNGIYRIAKGGAAQLLEGGNIVLRVQNGVVSGEATEFTGPSISAGKIAYLRRTYDAKTTSTALRVGTIGNVKTVLTLPPNVNAGDYYSYDRPSLAIVNGKVYFLSFPVDPNSTLPNSLNLVDTQVASPQLQTLRTGIDGTPVVSANTLLVANNTASSTEYFESTGDANFKPVSGLSNCGGTSVSHESIAAICGAVLKVRFGRQGAFFTVPDPYDVRFRRLANPSISDRSVLYTQYPSTRVPVDTGLYLSKNGQAPIRLLRAGNINGFGELLDGKKVGAAQLNKNGRSLAGNFAVCVVLFEGGSTALYRIDL